MTKQSKAPKVGLFIDRSTDGVQWHWSLIGKQGNVICDNFGHDTAQAAIKGIRATQRFFKGVPKPIFNKVTGFYVGVK